VNCVIGLGLSRCRECPNIFTYGPKPKSLVGATRLTGRLGHRSVGKSPPCVSGRRAHFYVKGCGSVPRGRILSAGLTLGSGARCARPQSPHTMYSQKSISASFGLPSFPVRDQSTPGRSRRQHERLLGPRTKVCTVLEQLGHCFVIVSGKRA
jgi:hypothetical protein